MTTSTQFWDGIAERYAAKPVANIPAYQRKLEITKARLRQRDAVLDLGCGTGSLALELAPHVAQVHSLDISAEMIKIARRKAADRGVTNTTFHQSTLEGPATFEPASFDGACAYNILHLLEDRKAALRTLFNLLRPGGFFISSTVCLRESWVPFGVILRVMRWLGKAPPVYILSAGQLETEMREAGFVDIRAHDVGASKTTAFVVAAKP